MCYPQVIKYFYRVGGLLLVSIRVKLKLGAIFESEIEQVWLNICTTKKERHELTEYQELAPNVILSELGMFKYYFYLLQKYEH